MTDTLIESRDVLEQLAEAVKWWNADEADEPDVRRLFETCRAEIVRLRGSLSEAVQRADAAERIADIAAIELVRSCAAPCGDGWLNPRGEDLEPELAYAVKRGLVVSEDGLLRFTELAWERAQYLTEEAP